MSASIFKAYDIRGLVDGEITSEFTFATGAAFARFLKGEREPGTVVIGEDMRPSSPTLADAFSAGITSQGLDVVRIGLASTDMLYFAAGKLNLPGAMFTASHNPAAYNGIKFSRAGAQGISLDTGLAAIRDRACDYLEKGLETVATPGSYREVDVLADYAGYLRSLVDLSGIKPIRVVVDAGNGMGGMTVPAVLGTAAGLPSLPIEIIPMYFELDGTFPNHEANPLDPKNLVDLQRAVIEHGADIGLAFDGDAVIFSDEAERIYVEGGLDAFNQNETESSEKPLPGGPFKPFLAALHDIQSDFPVKSSPIRTALITARGAPAHERVIKTLRSWGIRIDEALFLGGKEKGAFLKSFGADIFFDDQIRHCDSAAEYVATGHVPYGVKNAG